jgi:hypothetical protein
MDRSNQRKLQHLALHVAAVNVHIATVGSPPDPRDLPQMIAALDRMARAIAMAAPIYAREPDMERPVEIHASQLRDGRFSGGARVLTASDGRRYEGLTVQRGDMESVIALLNRAQPSVRAASGVAIPR